MFRHPAPRWTSRSSRNVYYNCDPSRGLSLGMSWFAWVRAPWKGALSSPSQDCPATQGAGDDTAAALCEAARQPTAAAAAEPRSSGEENTGALAASAQASGQSGSSAPDRPVNYQAAAANNTADGSGKRKRCLGQEVLTHQAQVVTTSRRCRCAQCDMRRKCFECRSCGLFLCHGESKSRCLVEHLPCDASTLSEREINMATDVCNAELWQYNDLVQACQRARLEKQDVVSRVRAALRQHQGELEEHVYN